MSKHKFKLIVLALWAALVGTAIYFWRSSGVELTTVPEMLQLWLKDFGLFKAAAIYVVIYTVRPLIFFPATLLTISSGLIFGPWWGILFTIIGENFSANFAFLVSRRLGRDWVQSKETAFLKKWDERLMCNGIVTVLIMRLIYLPFDAVHYACGLTSMKQRDFAIGTFIGILPGLTTFVLLGGTISPQVSGMLMVFGLNIDQRLFILSLSAFFFVIGLIVARVIRRRLDSDLCSTELKN